jgi:hypothetical protein
VRALVMADVPCRYLPADTCWCVYLVRRMQKEKWCFSYYFAGAQFRLAQACTAQLAPANTARLTRFAIEIAPQRRVTSLRA